MGSTLASRSMGGHGSAKVGIHCLSLHSLAFGQIPKAVTPDDDARRHKRRQRTTYHPTMMAFTSTSFKALALGALTLTACSCDAFAPVSSSVVVSSAQQIAVPSASSALYGKKKKNKGGGGGYGGGGGQQQQEKASVQEQRFDAATRQFMFTIMGLSKTLPDKSKTLLKDINLCFYPGAKIGVVGMNGSGKSTLLKIMAGVDKEFDGTARPLPGASIGYLPQEPELEFETVQECVDHAVSSSRKVLDEYNDLSMKLADPDITPDEMEKTMSDLEKIGDQIEASNLWELDRTVERAMDSLRVPPGDAKTAVLSGGEKRRVSLCQLLLASHDMILLDEPTNHLDAESIEWLEQFLAEYKGTVVSITHGAYFLYILLSVYIFVWSGVAMDADAICFNCLILSVDHRLVWFAIYYFIPHPPFHSCAALHPQIGIFSRTLPSGSWSLIVARVFHLRATIRHGWRQRTSVLRVRRSRKRLPPRPSLLSLSGFEAIQRQRAISQRLVSSVMMSYLRVRMLPRIFVPMPRFTFLRALAWAML